MIYSRFGEPVKIVEVTGETTVVVEFENGKMKEYETIYLRAEGGIQEIMDEMKKIANEPDENDDYSNHEGQQYQPSWFDDTTVQPQVDNKVDK